MRRLLSAVLVLALLAALGHVLYPYLKNAARVAELLREAPPAVGGLAHPLPGRPFVDTWGAARSNGRRHEGVDIFAPRGTPVQATSRGVVVRVGNNTLGGHTVMVMGAGGYNHYYAHLDRPSALTTGQWVQAGDVVGLVGTSGNARGTPPHLHYGIYLPSGQAVNPFPLLSPADPADASARSR